MNIDMTAWNGQTLIPFRDAFKAAARDDRLARPEAFIVAPWHHTALSALLNPRSLRDDGSAKAVYSVPVVSAR